MHRNVLKQALIAATKKALDDADINTAQFDKIRSMLKINQLDQLENALLTNLKNNPEAKTLISSLGHSVTDEDLDSFDLKKLKWQDHLSLIRIMMPALLAEAGAA